MPQSNFYKLSLALLTWQVFLNACQTNSSKENSSENQQADTLTGRKQSPKPAFLSKPLVSDIYTADPSAHVFNDKIYIYPSHDIESGTAQDDEGGHFDMKDYHIFSMDSPDGKITDHGVALDIKDVPWAGRQLWAPDAAFKNGKYYLYFPAKDKEDVFRIGVATSTSPTGPFKAEPHQLKAVLALTLLYLKIMMENTICTLVASGAANSTLAYRQI